MRVSMAAIIQQAERKFNLGEADGVNRRHTRTHMFWRMVGYTQRLPRVPLRLPHEPRRHGW